MALKKGYLRYSDWLRGVIKAIEAGMSQEGGSHFLRNMNSTAIRLTFDAPGFYRIWKRYHEIENHMRGQYPPPRNYAYLPSVARQEEYDKWVRETLQRTLEYLAQDVNFRHARRIYSDQCQSFTARVLALPNLKGVTAKFKRSRNKLKGMDIVHLSVTFIVIDVELVDHLLKGKGEEAGDIDWRPTEMLPEDYYAL